MGKKGGNTVSQIEALAKPVVEELGLSLWDVRFEKEGADWYLRILIDSQSGITLEDCEAVSRPLSKLLDEADPIDQSYYLEVSSPGTERVLRRQEHFEHCMGELICIKLIRPVDGRREFIGTLESYQDGNVLIKTETGSKSIALTDCASVKLVDSFDYDTIEG